MDLESLRRYCLSFPQATENLQWGDDLCFKIRGKIFVTIGLGVVPQCMCFKCTPESFAELTEREGIEPAPYVGRYNWVLLKHLDILRQHELTELVRQSYEMVSAKMHLGSAKATPSKRRTVAGNAKESPRKAAGKKKNRM